MGKYEEEIYDRAEKKFSSVSAQLDWLKTFEKPERGATKFTKDALKLRDELILADEIKSQASKTKDLDELQGYIDKLDGYDFYGRDAKEEVQGIFNKIEREEVRKQEREIAKEEARKQLEKEEAQERKRQFAEDLVERERVREEEPQRFGGFRSGEKRRGRVALRTFDENL